MACACSKSRLRQKFLWTSADGSSSVVYNSEVEAKAKVIRKGGSYEPLPLGG